MPFGRVPFGRFQLGIAAISSLLVPVGVFPTPFQHDRLVHSGADQERATWRRRARCGGREQTESSDAPSVRCGERHPEWRWRGPARSTLRKCLKDPLTAPSTKAPSKFKVWSCKPPGLLQKSLGKCPQSVPESVPEHGGCPREYQKVSRTLWGHSRDTFWTLRNPGPKGPGDTQSDTPSHTPHFRKHQGFSDPANP